MSSVQTLFALRNYIHIYESTNIANQLSALLQLFIISFKQGDYKHSLKRFCIKHQPHSFLIHAIIWQVAAFIVYSNDFLFPVFISPCNVNPTRKVLTSKQYNTCHWGHLSMSKSGYVFPILRLTYFFKGEANTIGDNPGLKQGCDSVLIIIIYSLRKEKLSFTESLSFHEMTSGTKANQNAIDLLLLCSLVTRWKLGLLRFVSLIIKFNHAIFLSTHHNISDKIDCD